MGGVKTVVALARNVVDDRVAGRLVVEQVGGEFQVLALDDDLDLLHWMQREIGHSYPPVERALRFGKTPGQNSAIDVNVAPPRRSRAMFTPSLFGNVEIAHLGRRS